MRGELKRSKKKKIKYNKTIIIIIVSYLENQHLSRQSYFFLSLYLNVAVCFILRRAATYNNKREGKNRVSVDFVHIIIMYHVWHLTV